MTPDQQLDAWVEGRPIHHVERGECCPDFSCCRPDLLAPAHERKTYVRLTERDRHHMRMVFLARAFAGHNVHIVDDSPAGHA